MKLKFQKGHTPWNKGLKGAQVAWNKGTKGVMVAWNKGKTNIYSANVIKRLRDANLGKHHTEETKRKRGESISLAWKNPLIRNKMIIAQSKQNGGWFKKGQISTNKGKHISQETKQKLFLANIGKKLTEETIQKIKVARAKQILPMQDTKIEVKIQRFLKQLDINFFTHQHRSEIEHSYQCDILIPSMNLVIECDGDYWHNYPIGNDIDHIRTKELIEKGFKVLRLWEREIKILDLNEFDKLLKGGNI